MDNNKISFFSNYSDEQLKRILAVEIRSNHDLSATVENIIEELKRRNPEIKVKDYTDTEGIIKYLSE